MRHKYKIIFLVEEYAFERVKIRCNSTSSTHTNNATTLSKSTHVCIPLKPYHYARTDSTLWCTDCPTCSMVKTWSAGRADPATLATPQN